MAGNPSLFSESFIRRELKVKVKIPFNEWKNLILSLLAEVSCLFSNTERIVKLLYCQNLSYASFPGRRCSLAVTGKAITIKIVRCSYCEISMQKPLNRSRIVGSSYMGLDLTRD